MEQIFDASIHKKGIDDIHKAVIDIEKKVPDEYIGSALFSVVIDAIETKSDIYKIPKLRRTNKKIHTQFKPM